MKRLVWLVVLALAGCASQRPKTFDPDPGPDPPEVLCVPFVKAAEVAWQKRDSEAGARDALRAFEQVSQCHPRHAFGWIGVAKSAALLANGYLEVARLQRWIASDDLVDEQIRLYALGLAAGRKALALAPDSKEALYWTVLNWHGWAVKKGFATVMAERDQIRPLIERLERLDANFYHGAPDRLWGIYFAVVPSFAGGNLEESERRFQRALDAAPAFFANRVEMAEHVAVKRQNRQLFYELLMGVLALPHDQLPDWRVEQRLEREKAELLLQAVPRLFVHWPFTASLGWLR